MVQMRVTILGIASRPPVAALYSAPDSGYINALFAGALLETMFLASARTYHIKQLK